MKKLKLFVMSLCAMFVAVLGVNAECNNVEAGAAASITNSSGTKYCESVKDAVDTAVTGDTVNLLKDFDFTESVITNRIEINNKDITFNFNTFKITATQLPSQYAAFVVKGTSKVTFTGKENGGIENKKGSSALLVTDTAEVKLAGGNFIQSGEATDGLSYTAISVYGATLTVEEDGASVSIDGGIGVFGTSPKLYVKSGTITADGFAVSGNGSTTTDSTIEISGGTLKSNTSAAIYHPQSGTLKVTDGDIEGKLGIVARGGIITVSGDVNIKATGKTTETYEVGDATDGEGKVKLPGGVGLLVDDTENYPAKSTLKATVDGGHFDTEGAPVEAYKNEAASATNLIEVKGGTFNQDVEPKYLNSSVEQSENGVVGIVSDIELGEAENGTVEFPKNAAKGEDVEVTITPDEGYEIAEMTVLDENGEELPFETTETGLIFTMPEGAVTISVKFTKADLGKADTTELEKAIAEAEKYLDDKKYDAKQVEALKKLIEEAKGLLDADKEGQDTVDAMVEVLKDATTKVANTGDNIMNVVATGMVSLAIIAGGIVLIRKNKFNN